MKRFITVGLMLFVLGVATPAVLFAAGSVDAVEQMAKVSINAGSSVELQTLPGIGEVTAERIVVYRQQNGPFASIDALTNVKGVGVKTLAKIRSKVAL
jgi:competence protein ComEA